ncbi:hypothetical protein AB85_2427 [Escherichia coli 2-156-04_S3_C1]|nr:hypothetical protein AB85_2427 [Escherichia coli 2-156-04_S3_C1]
MKHKCKQLGLLSAAKKAGYSAVRTVLHNVSLLISHYNEDHIHGVCIGEQMQVI